MHVIVPLVSGLLGAELGTVSVFRRGTAIQAEIYSDFFGATAAVNPVALDANGSVSLYSNELCDVEVKDANGNIVRSFIDCVGDSSVEVRSASFNGKDYSTGDVAPGNPTTLRDVLAKWLISAGATDFQVLGPDGPEGISDLVSRFSPVFINVKDVAYGAKGDGVTDDSAAFVAADAAVVALGGGILWMPSGEYSVSGVILGAGTSLMGPGSGSCSIKNRTSTGVGILTFSGTTGARFLQGFSFVSGAGGSRIPIEVSQNEQIQITDVYAIDTVFTYDACIAVDSGCSIDCNVVIDSCSLLLCNYSGAWIANSSSVARVTADGCRFITQAQATHGTGQAGIFGPNISLRNCFVDMTHLAIGTLYFFLPGVNPCFGSSVGTEFSETAGGSCVAFRLEDESYSADCFEELATIISPSNTNVALAYYAATAIGGYCKFNSRDAGEAIGTVTASTFTLDALGNGLYSLKNTYAGDFALLAGSVGPPGARLSVIVYNDDASTRTITWSTNMRGAAYALAAANAVGFEFVSAWVQRDSDSVLVWTMVGVSGGLFPV